MGGCHNVFKNNDCGNPKGYCIYISNQSSSCQNIVYDNNKVHGTNKGLTNVKVKIGQWNDWNDWNDWLSNEIKRTLKMINFIKNLI